MVRVQKQEEKDFNNLQQSNLSSEVIQASLGVLQSASDFQILGGNISSIGGDSTSFTARGDVHVTINHHHSPSPTPSVSSSSSNSINIPDEYREQRLEDTFSAQNTSRRSSPEAMVQSTVTIQRNCDIYRYRLATKGRGLPLWIPEPSRNLPIQYQRQGISAGDIGVVTSSGGFTFLFNIFLPRNHPINPPIMPDGYKPLRVIHPLDTVSSQRDLKDNSYLASPSNIRARRDRGTANLIFESSECDGAILTMPVGAKSEDLACMARLRKYVAANMTSWYRYACHYRGMELQNGDLKVVTGCDKTSAWGMACLSSSVHPRRESDSLSSPGEDRRFYLEFGPTENDLRRGGGRYEWAYSGEVAEVRAGPDASEVAQLRGHVEAEDQDEDNEHYENQCLFLRTMNAMLPEEGWQELMSEEEEEEEEDDEDDLEEEEADVDHRYGRGPSGYPRNTNRRSGISRQGNHNSQRGGAQREGRNLSSFRSEVATPASRTNVALDASDMASVFPSRLMSLEDHPSIAINNFLLQNCSDNATMAVSLDQDWMSVLREDDTILPSSEELLERILEHYDVHEEEGMVFFDSKHTVTETPDVVEDETECCDVSDVEEPELTRQHAEAMKAAIEHSPDVSEGISTPEEIDNQRTGRTNKKKALLIGLRYLERSDASEEVEPRVTSQPHNDVAVMRRYLEDGLGYDPQDIVVLVDNDDEPDHVQPTRENIIRQMRKLVEDAQAGDQFFFLFAGHSGQETIDGLEEEDGKSEYIATSDSKMITDNDLRKILVDPLPSHCSLVGVFDSCHSGSLLDIPDIPHYRCNRVNLPWVSKRKQGTRNGTPSRRFRRTDSMVDESSERDRSSFLRRQELVDRIIRKRTAIHPFFDQTLALDEDPPRSKLDRPQRASNGEFGSALASGSFWDKENALDSPMSVLDDGDSDKIPTGNQNESSETKPDVIFLSTSRDSDSQTDPLGNYIAQGLLDILRKNVKPRLDKIVSHISHNLSTNPNVIHSQGEIFQAAQMRVRPTNAYLGHVD